jgi:hypothetical protein
VPKNADAMRKMFDVHVPYELGRLDEMYRLLAEPDLLNFKAIPEPHRDTVRDALIVGFCIHAKNLMEFFAGKPEPLHACAKDFANGEYQPLRVAHRSRLHELKGMLNNQLSHLSYERANDPQEKIDIQERKDFLDVIHAELVRWKAALQSGYAALQSGYEEAQLTTSTDRLADARVLIMNAAIGGTASITHSTSPPSGQVTPVFNPAKP